MTTPPESQENTRRPSDISLETAPGDLDYEIIGTGDLRFNGQPSMGFAHILLRSADDGDCIVVNEDDVRPLIRRLQEHVDKHKL